jgi:uncharacterized membrane protein
MVALPYNQTESRTRRISRPRDNYADVRLNWRLIVALGLNFVMWVALVKLISNFI